MRVIAAKRQGSSGEIKKAGSSQEDHETEGVVRPRDRLVRNPILIVDVIGHIRMSQAGIASSQHFGHSDYSTALGNRSAKSRVGGRAFPEGPVGGDQAAVLSINSGAIRRVLARPSACLISIPSLVPLFTRIWASQRPPLTWDSIMMLAAMPNRSPQKLRWFSADNGAGFNRTVLDQAFLGRSVMPTTRAVRKAGQAVAACEFGIKFDHITLRDDQSGNDLKIVDWLYLPATNSRQVRSRHENFITTLLAGREAMQVLLGKSSKRDEDYKRAKRYIETWLPWLDESSVDIITKQRGRAARLMKRKKRAVLRVATALDGHGMLTAREVRTLCKRQRNGLA